MAKKRPAYDFADIHIMAESDSFTWDDIAAKYNRAKSSVHEAYNRWLSKRKAEINQSMKNDGNTSINDNNNDSNNNNDNNDKNDDEEKIPSLSIDDEGNFLYNQRLIDTVTYGHIEATDYRDITEDEFHNLAIDELVLRVDDWIRQYFPYQYSWSPTPHYLLWIIKMFLQALRNLDFGSNKKRFELEAIMKLLVLIARFHGKTTLMIGMFSWWTIDQKKSLTVIANPGKKDDIFDTVVGVMQSPMIRYYYGDFIDSSNKTLMKVKFIHKWQKHNHDAMFNVATLKGGYVGTHAKWTHLEDPIQKIAASKQTMKRWTNEFDDNLRDLSAVITVTATRKGPDDFYAYLLQKGFLSLRKDAVVFHKGDFPTYDDMIFHETETQRIAKGLKESYVKSVVYETLECPDWSFLRLMLRYWEDKNSFYSQFMNLPRSRSGGYFEEWHYQEAKPIALDIIKSSPLFGLIDPAFGKTAKSSDTALIFFFYYQATMFITEILAGKYMQQDIEAAVKAQRQKYGDIFNWIKIEDDYAQISNRFQSGWTTRNKISTFTSGGEGNKIARIERLYEPFQFKYIQVMPWCRDKEKFEDQIRAFDQDPNGKWDILDAVASAYRLTKKKLKATTGTGVNVI